MYRLKIPIYTIAIVRATIKLLMLVMYVLKDI